MSSAFTISASDVPAKFIYSHKSKKDFILNIPYWLTRGFLSNKISVSENRILLLMLQRVKFLQYTKVLDGKVGLNYHPSFYFDVTGLVPHNNVSRLEGILTGMCRDFEVSKGRTTAAVHVPFVMGYSKKEMCPTTNTLKCRLTISQDLCNSFLDLTGGYGSVFLNTAFSLSNVYSIKLYYHINQWFKVLKYDNSDVMLSAGLKSKTYFTAEELYKYFAIDAKHSSCHVRAKLIAAKKELDKKSEVSFSFLEKKKGAKVLGYSFVYYRNISKADLLRKRRESLKTLTDAENSLFEIYSKAHALSPGDKSILYTIIAKYGYSICNYTLKSEASSIDSYMKRRQMSFVMAFGIIVQGVYQRFLQLPIRGDTKQCA